jgi:hypothetical protein
MSEMMQKCTQCGAELRSTETCQQRFDLCMALEFENPTAFETVHHLAVACYMLQHNAYSRNAWLEARSMIVKFMQEGITPAEMRERYQARFDSRHRKWSITKGVKLCGFDEVIWTRSIVDIRLDNPEVYCADVKLWAASVLTDTEIILQRISPASPAG